ncbi:hypothetical protein L1D44_18905 [Shewanella sp. Isolate13]|uniref:hypothetical protein n=1 Tax=Shewanella sp. Isolate13 TaxID=2908531 RepID=UPI001EFD1DA2|nr:hypothetical protein [Shewanella sp. Isolate13]MCG9731862.1 hypothetical protein [Shewanella sp. Isolate13]
MFFRSLLICAILLAGCTSRLWQPPSYDEKVTGFYGVKDKEILIVTGQEYSYIFDASDQFKDVLKASRKVDLRPKYTKFKIDSDNNVTGHLRLLSYNSDDKSVLSNLGFNENEFGNMEMNISLKGQRYIVEGDFPFEKLEDDHYVKVEIPENGIATVGKIIVTPAAVTIDAAAIIPLGSMFAILGLMNKYDL